MSIVGTRPPLPSEWKDYELHHRANHIIMDYSIHDAIEAGFNHVVFIIRKDIEKELFIHN